MKTEALRKLMKGWSRKAGHCREQALLAWRDGLPSNRLLGTAEGYEHCTADLLRVVGR